MPSFEDISQEYNNLDVEVEIKSEKSIRSDLLLGFDYEYSQSGAEVIIDSDEFTAVCPLTGLPDFGTLFIKYPILFDILRYVGSAYIIYLAYKMFGSLNISKSEDRSRPLKYYEAILFQFVNPKAWVICSTAVTLYYPKNENINKQKY